MTDESKAIEVITDAALDLLDADQLAAAVQLNPYYANKLGGVPWDDAQPWSDLFAYRVATIQHGAGIEVDGVYGPKTFAVLRTTGGMLELKTIDALRIGGELVEVPFPVVDWTEARQGGMSFYDHPSTWRSRSKDRAVDMFVLHWDVCPSSQSCYQALVRRGLSVHLMLDADGMVYQSLDLRDAVAYHASSSDVEGPENLRSGGIELNNPVLLDRKNDAGRAVVTNQPKPNSRDSWDHFDFTPIQKERVAQLCVAICDAMGIAKTFPLGTNLVAGRKEAVGVVGHYHLKSSKIDPGLTLWAGLEGAGFKSE